MAQPLVQVGQDLVVLSDFVYERLRARLAGLTDHEYFWEPAPGCWSVRRGADGQYRMDGDEAEPDPDPSPLTTVAWRLCHIVDVLTGGHNAPWLGVPTTTEARWVGEPATASAALERLDEAYAVFRSLLSTVDRSTLVDAIGEVSRFYGDSTRLAFALHLLDELIHHAAEVGTMRDVYRALQSSPA